MQAAEAPIWRVDLRSFGYQGYKRPREFPRQSVLDPLGFSSRDVLIASFLTREIVPVAPHRDQAHADLPLKLHAVFLNATAGAVKTAKEWSTPYPVSVDIVPTRNGKFIVVIRQHLTLYSRDMEPLRDLSLSTPTGPQGDLQLIEVSPQRGSLLLVYFRGEHRINWIRADDLAIMRSWGGPVVPSSISDNEAAIHREDYVKSRGFLVENLLRDPANESRTLCRAWLGYDLNRSCAFPQFISNELLAFLLPHELNVLPVQGGDPLVTARLPENEWLGPKGLRPSSDGKRLAIAVSRHEGGSETLDINYHGVLKRIMVFDIPSRQWIYTLDAKKQKIKTISGLALSPDGSLMAIMTDGIVEVYRLPPFSPDQQPPPQR